MLETVQNLWLEIRHNLAAVSRHIPFDVAPSEILVSSMN